MARKYWIVSPNVNGSNQLVDEWKGKIIQKRIAIMGWPPDPHDDSQMRFGQRFAGIIDPGVDAGDAMLVARSNNLEAEVVGCGIVDGENVEKEYSFYDRTVYTRALKPFVPLTNVPTSVPLIESLGNEFPLRQLYPGENDAHLKICEWMEELLETEEEKTELADDVKITESDLPEVSTFGYKVKTRTQVKETREVEARLRRKYYNWLKNKGHRLSILTYNRLSCDGWEGNRENLIEAKGSISREDIRMAVEQLLDYSYQGRDRCKNPHLAVLLPKKPTSSIINWLNSLEIKIIWRNGPIFEDNSDGQFT